MRRAILPVFLLSVILVLLTKQCVMDTAFGAPGLFQGVFSGRWLVGV